MSASRQGKTTNSFDDVLGTAINEDRMSQWGNMPGRVVSFDAAKQTATIQPLFKPKFNGTPVDMPELLEVPVRFQRAGGMAITMPIKPGALVDLRPQMRSSENYLTDGNGAASDSRSFNLSDMEAHITGGEPLSDPIQNFNNENTHLRANAAGTFGIEMSEDGKVAIKGAQGDTMDLTAEAIEKTADGFAKLGTEALVHAASYTQISADLTIIANKLRGMQLP